MIIKKKTLLLVWFGLLLLSFAYELPIYIFSSIDRLNPRLFDVVTFLGLIIFPFTNKPENSPLFFKKYKSLIFWFGLCVLATLVVYAFPTDIELYAFYFYIKYIQELFVLIIAYRVLREYNSLKLFFFIFLISGLFVFGYSIYELYYGITGEIEFAPGKFMIKPEGVVWGPFGKSYFQIANYLPLMFLFVFGLATYYKGIKKLIFFSFSFFIAWPLLFTGSRTGLGLLLFSLIFFLVFRFKFHFTLIFGILIAASSLFLYYSIESDKFLTIDRMTEMENHEANSITSRIALFESFDLKAYVYNGFLVPIFGGGFYVAPRDGDFRIGYGFHNIYLFAFEQAGIFGFYLFIIFLKSTYRELKLKLNIFRTRKNSLEYIFVLVVFSYFLASLLLGLAGHTFWRGFSTNNFNTLRITILLMAVTIPIISKKIYNEKGIIN